MSEENDFEKELSQEDLIYHSLMALTQESYDKLVARCHIGRLKKEEKKRLEQEEVKKQQKEDRIVRNIIFCVILAIIGYIVYTIFTT